MIFPITALGKKHEKEVGLSGDPPPQSDRRAAGTNNNRGRCAHGAKARRRAGSRRNGQDNGPAHIRSIRGGFLQSAGPIMRLTTTAVRTQPLPAGKGEAIFFDDDIPGFGLRVREGGSRNFVFQYKLGAKQRRIALGKDTPERLADVRKAVDKLYARVKLGQDPASDKALAQRQAAEAFGSCKDDFLKTLQTREDPYRPRAYKEIERHLK